MFYASAAKPLAKIGKIQGVIQRLGEIPRSLAREAAPGINDLIQEQFKAGLDPYGRRWRPLSKATRAKGRRNPPLTASGALAENTKVVTGPGLRFKLGRPYGYFHQVGTSNMPARRIFPQNGIPRAWSAVIRQAASRLAARARAA